MEIRKRMSLLNYQSNTSILPIAILTLISVNFRHYFRKKLEFFSGSIFIRLIGLLELPEAIESSDYAQPVELAPNCLPHMGDVEVIAIGRGATEAEAKSYADIWDKRIRHVELETLSKSECMKETELSPLLTHSASVICARSSNDRAAYFGDSGILRIFILPTNFVKVA